MSWLYSRALVEEYSEATCLDGALSALLSLSHTPRAFLSPDKMTAFSRLSRFGMTFAPLTDDLGAELLTWFLEASRAKTSQSQEKAQALTGSDPAYGPKWRELWARYDRDTCLWRTPQPSLLVDSDELSPTWPRSGMNADGLCWALPMLGRRTIETDSGLWPTPTAHNAKEGGFPAEHDRNTPTLAAQAGGHLNPTWVEWLMGWPLGWTDLKPLATDKCPSVPQQLGDC